MRSQNLRDCLLDHAVLHRRDAQHSGASVRLWDIDATHREGNVRSLSDVRADARAMLGKVPRALVDSHAVNPRSSLIGYHPVACLKHVPW